MVKFKDLLEGIQILEKYIDVDDFCAAEHDQIYFPESKHEISQIDRIELDKLGFFFDDEFESWSVFT